MTGGTTEHRNDNLRGRQREFLDYARSILNELQTMAAAERLPFLAFLLETSYIETCDTLRSGEATQVAKISHQALAAIR